MGKRRMQVRQVRQKTRVVKPKVPAQAAPATSQDQRKQQQRFLAAGGFLQGYAPEQVIRLGYLSGGFMVLCVLIMVELIFGPVAPHDLLMRIIAALGWVVPIAIVGSFVAPGVRLAFSDRKAEARVVQGQLLGASSVSTSFGLGMLMIKTRAGNEQYLCPPEKLAKVPGNQVQVIVTVTPRLRYVKALQVMGQRLMPRPEPPVPAILNRLRLLPLVTPAALAAAVVIGDDAVALAPIPNVVIHAILAVLTGAVLAGGVYLASMFLQRRLTAQAQALVPTGM